jgi:hypothetical protein
MGNIIWVVYNKKGKVVSFSKDQKTAKIEALRKSKYRWTYQTIRKDWGYLVDDGYKLIRSTLVYNIKN